MSLVTLITDFGSKDYYVALMKASILSKVPSAYFVDINHDISPHDIMEGAFFLKSVYQTFPEGTIHLVLVNSFYNKINSLITFEKGGHYFAGPNNGLFSLVFNDLDQLDVVEVLDETHSAKSLYDLSSFIIGQWFQGSDLHAFGNPPAHLERKLNLQPVITGNQIRATIIHVDHFGNVIVNLDKATFHQVCDGREYAIYYKSKDPVTRISKFYSNVQPGDVCALFNSIDLLEIAVNLGNAHELLTLNKNETIQINFY